jgi:hypothetical protein
MNALHACLFMALAFVGADAQAHPPGASGTQTDAPSLRTCDSDRRIAQQPCVIERPNDSRVDAPESTQDCSARCAMGEASIDWYAVPPLEPHYAPQIPAEWWWRHSHWRTWRPR